MNLRTYSHYFLLVLLSLVLYSCGDDDPVGPAPNPGVDLSDAESIKAFFENLSGVPLSVSKLYLEDSARIGVKCEHSLEPNRCDSVYFQDLHADFDECKRDDYYVFDYSYGAIDVMVNENELVCQDTRFKAPFEAFRIQLSGTGRVGDVYFNSDYSNEPINRFFSFKLSEPLTSTSFIQMFWQFTHLSQDSINVSATFNDVNIPPLTIQFKPS